MDLVFIRIPVTGAVTHQRMNNVEYWRMLKILQEEVGGFFERVTTTHLAKLRHVDHPTPMIVMLVDEDGYIRSKQVNPRASTLYGDPRDEIVGDALIMAEGRTANGDYDFVPLPDYFTLDYLQTVTGMDMIG